MKSIKRARTESKGSRGTMSMLLLAFITSALAASIDFHDVSQRFDESLEKMVEDLKGSGLETASIGTFPGEENLIQDAIMRDLSTIRRETPANLMEMWGRQSVQGSITLGEMVIEERAGNDNRKIVVGENLWSYNFWVNPESENCNDGVTILLTDMGEMKLIADGQLTGKDVTYWAKHNMADATSRKIVGAINDAFKNHFDFCNLLKD